MNGTGEEPTEDPQGPSTDPQPARGDNRFDIYQRAHNWIGIPVAVIYKLIDDQGIYLAALITYYGFLSLFPLLLLGATVLGFILNGNAALQSQILSSAVVDFPVVGTQLQKNIHAYTGSTSAVVISVLIAVYGGLGVAQAAQNAMNIVWGVPRNRRPNPIKARIRSVAILGLLGLAVLLTTALSAVATGAHSVSTNYNFGRLTDLAFILGAALLNVVLFTVAFRFLTTRETSVREVFLGSALAGITWEVLQVIGTYYMAHKLKGAREIYGVFALVLGLVGWIYIEAVVVVFCAELNVVIRRRLWPRSLLTPFTDDVDLTSADVRAYGSYAKAQRFKGGERIRVTFSRRRRSEGDQAVQPDEETSHSEDDRDQLSG